MSSSEKISKVEMPLFVTRAREFTAGGAGCGDGQQIPGCTKREFFMGSSGFSKPASNYIIHAFCHFFLFYSSHPHMDTHTHTHTLI